MLENRKDLMEYRLERAKENLESAELLFKGGKYKDSIGKSYYAIFTSARALLASDGMDYSKHSGVISYFQREYVKTRKFDVRFSEYISGAFKVRKDADYADFYIAAKSDAETQGDLTTRTQ